MNITFMCSLNLISYIDVIVLALISSVSKQIMSQFIMNTLHHFKAGLVCNGKKIC